MLRQIVFIYRDEFVARLAERLMKQASIQCYSLAEITENFAYIIDDLKPELVIVDEKSYEANREMIDQSFSDSKKDFKSVLLSKGQDPQGFDLIIPLPLNIDTFIPQTLSLVENSGENGVK